MSLESSLLDARNRLAAGHADAAATAYRQVLQLDADNLEALNALAVHALHRAELRTARELIDHAQRVQPDHPLTLLHEAQLTEAEGDPDHAVAVYQRLLGKRPGMYLARLQLGRLLEDRQGLETAVPHYFRAVTDAQREGRWRGKSTTPPGLQPYVEHAIKVAGQHREAMFAETLRPCRERYGSAALYRIDLAVEVLMARARYTPGNNQAPSFLAIPELPVQRYFDTQRFPQMRELEANFAAILGEFEALLPEAGQGVRVFGSDELEQRYLSNHHQQAPSWTGHYFYRYGVRNEALHQRCPVTSALIDALPLCRIRDHGPEVLFSLMTPGTHLLPHCGITNSRVVGHLGLVIPPDCALGVDGEHYAWVPGQTVVFDDTYPHEAWNRSQAMRAVLIFDMWHPDLSEAEREAVRALVEVIGDFRKASEFPG